MSKQTIAVTDTQRGILETMYKAEEATGKPAKGWCAIDIKDRGYKNTTGVISRSLQKLAEKKLVRLLKTKSKDTFFYNLTAAGKKIAKA